MNKSSEEITGRPAGWIYPGLTIVDHLISTAPPVDEQWFTDNYEGKEIDVNVKWRTDYTRAMIQERNNLVRDLNLPAAPGENYRILLICVIVTMIVSMGSAAAAFLMYLKIFGK